MRSTFQIHLAFRSSNHFSFFLEPRLSVSRSGNTGLGLANHSWSGQYRVDFIKEQAPRDLLS